MTVSACSVTSDYYLPSMFLINVALLCFLRCAFLGLLTSYLRVPPKATVTRHYFSTDLSRRCNLLAGGQTHLALTEHAGRRTDRSSY